MSDLNYTSLSKQLNVSPKAAQRIVGSTKIEINKPGTNESITYEVGLRIEKKHLGADAAPKILKESDVIAVCRKYAQYCPGVYNWLCSGDFVNNSLATTVTIANVVHACRTAGRLRAELIKS